MKRREFDYYIFIDFSENLIGYNIIQKENVKEILPKISRFRHYRGLKNRKIYLNHVSNTIKREKIKSYFEKTKIMRLHNNVEIFAEVLDFIKKHESCIIFISVDDFQYRSFKKLVGIIDGNTEVVRESRIKKGTPEHRLSLVIDNLLNIERRKNA